MSAVSVDLYSAGSMPFSPAVFSAGQFVMDGESLRVQPRATVRQIVAENPRLARVFEKYGLSYCCCGGNLSLVDLCAERGIPVESILADLRAAVSAAVPVAETDWYDGSLSDHMRHLLGKHHAYLHAELPRISFLMDRVTSRHGELYPELWELQAIFEEFRDVLEKHLEREERTLFPLLMCLEDGAASRGAPGVPHLVAELRQEHIQLTDALARMHCSTGGFDSPNTACNTYRVLMESLREMGIELCHHLTEEETILFPRAIAAVKSRF